MFSKNIETNPRDWVKTVIACLEDANPAENANQKVRWISKNARRAIKLQLPAPESVKYMRMIALITLDLLPVVLNTPQKTEHYTKQLGKIKDYAKKILASMERNGEKKEGAQGSDGPEEQKLTKEQEIRQLIEEYSGFLKNQGIDVAQSALENRWFCYQYNKEYKYYDFFIEFETAEELADIILNELIFELELEEGKSAYPPELKNSNIADVVTVHYSHNYILVLEKLLQRVLNTELGKNSAFFKALDKLVTLARKEPQ